MEDLQILFVITLRLQITQTFIIVIRIKLLQPERKQRKKSHPNQQMYHFHTVQFIYSAGHPYLDGRYL